MKVLLANPKGFCAGVRRAVEIVNKALEIYGSPLYVKHEIVHNKFVVEQLKEKGVVFVDKIEDVPEGKVVVFSAHGSAPEEYEKAKERNLTVVDATCPLVTKVHLEARRYTREGYCIILIGHKGHIEVLGTAAEGKDNVYIIETEEEAKEIKFDDGKKLAYLTQTTLSVEETKNIIAILKKRFPEITAPPSSDICFSTTNRQMAVKEIAEKSQVVLVVGSKSSSNSNRLREAAESVGARAYLIDGADEIEESWLAGVETVGVTAGASAPDISIGGVVDFLKDVGASEFEEVVSVEEKIHFPLPKIG